MAEHTPTPWRADSPRSYAGVKWDNIIRSEAKHDPVCSVFFAGYMAKEAAANAAFIVKAVNNHDALVKALQITRNMIRESMVEDAVIDANTMEPLGKMIDRVLGAVGSPVLTHEKGKQ